MDYVALAALFFAVVVGSVGGNGMGKGMKGRQGKGRDSKG